jgi:hypothetical protein
MGDLEVTASSDDTKENFFSRSGDIDMTKNVLMSLILPYYYNMYLMMA